MEGEEHEREFPVYMVYCKWTVGTMYDFLQEHGEENEEYEDFIRVVYDKYGETDRSIVMVSDKTYENLCSKNYDEKGKEFRIIPYKLNKRDFPTEEHSRNLFVPVPKSLCKDENFVKRSITEKLQYLSDWGIIDEKSWRVNPIISSRETGGVKSGAFVIFNDKIELDQIAMVRILLTDTFWPLNLSDSDCESERERFRCVWARKMKPQSESPTGDQKSKKKILKSKK